MAHWKELYSGSDYLAAAEFGTRTFTAKIESAGSTEVEDDAGKTSRKGIVRFAGHQKAWMCCKTNSMCLAAMFGDDYTKWSGHSVTLFATMVKVGKSQELGIRVAGSPELTEPVKATIKLPRRKPFTMVLKPTGKQNGAAVKPKEPEPTPEPEPTEAPPPAPGSEEEIPF